MKFKLYFQQKRKRIQDCITQTLLQWQRTVEKKTPILHQITGLLLQTNQGGKMIRGTLVCLGYDLYAKTKSKEIEKIAAAYELLHSAFLIHDDIIDKSPLRRGKKTVHQHIGGEYGISQAICLGDVEVFLSNKLIAQTTFSPEIKILIMEQFSRISLDTILGEMLDIENAEKKDWNTKNIFLIYELKTAAYTIVGPLLLGAMISGNVSSIQKKAIIQFGMELGIAFQIQDDVLGIFGDEQKLGKSVTSDITEGKNTLLIAYALEHATVQQKKVLHDLYGKKIITKQEYAVIRNIFQETGALDYCLEETKKRFTEAKKIIPRLTTDNAMQTMTNDFVNSLFFRKK
jgi:geranylgeranyl diphosphate synthase, type I